MMKVGHFQFQSVCAGHGDVVERSNNKKDRGFCLGLSFCVLRGVLLLWGLLLCGVVEWGGDREGGVGGSVQRGGGIDAWCQIC